MQRETSKRLKPQGSEYRGGAQGRSSSQEGGRFCNGTGPKGLQCSAATQGQPVAAGALWPGKAVFHPEAGRLERLAEGKGQPRSVWRRRADDLRSSRLILLTTST